MPRAPFDLSRSASTEGWPEPHASLFAFLADLYEQTAIMRATSPSNLAGLGDALLAELESRLIGLATLVMVDLRGRLSEGREPSAHDPE